MIIQELRAADFAIDELEEAIDALLGIAPWAPPLTCWWNVYEQRGACNGRAVTQRCIHCPRQPEFCPYCSSDKVKVYPCQRPKEHRK